MKLTAAKRKAMPKKDFAGPGKSFPISDKTHARLAISGATRAEHAGNISEHTAEHIKARARAKLGRQHLQPMNPHGSRHGGPHEHLSPTHAHFHKL